MSHVAGTTRLSALNLERLGFHAEDEDDFLALVRHASQDAHRLEELEGLVCGLRSNIGRFLDRTRVLAEVSRKEDPEHGRTALLALACVAEDVAVEYLRRGVPQDLAWRSLSDLGQQVHIHRRVFGRFGFSAQEWCQDNFTGRLLWLGRLQYTLEEDRDGATGSEGSRVLAVHIPESGALTPGLVDESLRLAGEVALPAYCDFEPQMITLHSWLLDPAIIGALDSESNLVRFARRFELYADPVCGCRDALFFGFHLEPEQQDVDLDALPQETSLQRAIVRQLRKGCVGVHAGRLLGWPGHTTPPQRGGSPSP